MMSMHQKENNKTNNQSLRQPRHCERSEAIRRNFIAEGIYREAFYRRSPFPVIANGVKQSVFSIFN